MDEAGQDKGWRGRERQGSREHGRAGSDGIRQGMGIGVGQVEMGKVEIERMGQNGGNKG